MGTWVVASKRRCVEVTALNHTSVWTGLAHIFGIGNLFSLCEEIVTFIQTFNLVLIVGSCIQQRDSMGTEVAAYQRKLPSSRVPREMSWVEHSRIFPDFDAVK